MGFELPHHLRKYIVRQEDRSYTPVDHAVWRYCLRQLRDYLGTHAHESYLGGLEKSGIDVERIPQISAISERLSQFGWQARPVSGFIPPAAFMELQALNVLPIASDIRSLDHILYTPAPDIVHEAAGHAPMLANEEFAEYLRQYAQVAKKAIISKEDMDVYAAIRDLSDIKESPQSSPGDVAQAEKNLEQAIRNVSHVSEATWLSRMNWWTAEYGLIGSLESPKIYGAGLLSSVGEAKLCLSSKVKKLPLTIECIETTYDITEPQPQLFVTPDFAHLGTVLDELANRMAFRLGGREGLNRAVQAETVNTVELNSRLQISGVLVEVVAEQPKEMGYLRFQGPTQLSCSDKELPGHGKSYHSHGFGTPVGCLKTHPGVCPSRLKDSEWHELGATPDGRMELEFESGVRVVGDFAGRLETGGRSVLLTLENARVTWGKRVLFEPAWGTFDMALGSEVTSVFGGPADRLAFGDVDDFVAKTIPQPVPTEAEKSRHQLYQKARDLREQKARGEVLTSALATLQQEVTRALPVADWLIRLEILELANREQHPDLISKCKVELQQAVEKHPHLAEVIREGIRLSAD